VDVKMDKIVHDMLSQHLEEAPRTIDGTPGGTVEIELGLGHELAGVVYGTTRREFQRMGRTTESEAAA
jgi:hypothetical protein